MRSGWTLLFLMLTITTSAQVHIDADSVASLSPKVPLSHYFIFKTGPIIKSCETCLPFESATFNATVETGLRVGKGLSIGGGFGFTSFSYIHSVPVFGNVSLNFGKKNQVIAGWKIGGSKVTRFDNGYGDYGLKEKSGGLLSEPYLGYMIAYHDLRVYLLAGHITQRFSKRYEYPNVLYVNGELTEFEPSTREVGMELRRLSLGVGIGWK